MRLSIYKVSDGAVLISAGDQWNTDQLWSVSTAASWGVMSTMFDGVMPYSSGTWENWYASGYQSNNTPITCTFTTAVPVSSSFRAYVYRSNAD